MKTPNLTDLKANPLEVFGFILLSPLCNPFYVGEKYPSDFSCMGRILMLFSFRKKLSKQDKVCVT